jgi:hypothetical protein
MCYSYERLQPADEERRRELLGLQKKWQADLDRARLEQIERAAPKEPARAREKVPA